MKKLLLAGVVGFAIGVFLFAVGREVVRAFAGQSASAAISHVLSAVGSLQWVDTTLVTGLAAVIAAVLSIRAVREQIAADERAVRLQLLQTKELDELTKKAKHTAIRAVLPLALSAVCRYAHECAVVCTSTVPKLENGQRLRPEDRPQDIPSLPASVIDVIKEMIEFGGAADREYLAKLISSIQVQAARLSSIGVKATGTGPTLTLRENILGNVLDAAEVYAYASSLFHYARDHTKPVPNKLEIEGLRTAINIVSGYGALTDEIQSKAQLLFDCGYYDSK